MAYIGPLPAETFTSFATQEFSTSATTSYTLDHAVTNENEIALLINNVRQQPGSGKAYTASGTALTLSAATASTDTMYAVFLGRALQTVNPADASVGTSQLAATSVTAAKLNNDIISGTTALAEAPADTDEFLVSDAGTLKRIDYSYIKGGGAFELITSTTVSSGVSSVDFTSSHITTTYRDYRVVISGVIGSSDDVKLRLLLSTNGGSSFRTDSDHDFALLGIEADNNNTNFETEEDQSFINLTNPDTQGGATGESGSYIIDLFDPLNQTSDNSFFHGMVRNVYRGTQGDIQAGFGGFGQADSGFEDQAFNGFQFKYSSGNINQGIFSLYGRKI